LGLKQEGDGQGKGESSNNPWMKKIKLFSLKGGLELMDHDFMVTMSDHIYLFFSMGKFFYFIFYFFR
jgi:hypothetical protein